MKSLITKVPPIRKLNSLYYHYRSNRWRWSSRFRATPASKIDRPIFLLGTQGGGLTLLSRILRRHPAVVSVTGNSECWAGDDETQNVLAQILPEQLGWRDVIVPGYDTRDHNWLYANSEFLPYYRESAKSADTDLKIRYQTLLRRIINLQSMRGISESVRFMDKSQSLTVRVALVHALLCEFSPKFVLLVRNPFATIWRAATKDAILLATGRTLEQRLIIATEHWKNSFLCALADSRDKHISLRTWRFEDLLVFPEHTIKEICAHVELPYTPSILPGPHDSIPWGSAFDAFNKKKWYPLRRDVNETYLMNLPPWASNIIQSECGTLIKQFNYACS